jgi:NDP-sugar pyrophosphorylase family protein
MLEFHQQRRAELTVGVRHYELEVPYGVLQTREGYVRALQEKPRFEFMVSAGIYLLEPSVCRAIRMGERLDMTDLIRTLLHQGRVVVSFPIVEYWLDIGRDTDFHQAQEDMKQRRGAA